MDEMTPDYDIQPVDRKQSGAIGEIYEWVDWFLGVVIIAVLLLTFGLRTVGVFGESMEPTLLEGDSLIVTRIGGSPSNGDIIAITQPNRTHQPLIKRVVAVGGQTLDINFDTGDVTVDGVTLDEPYIAERIDEFSRYDVAFPLVVSEGSLFVMGDNRNHSLDSRASDIGMIDTRYVLGKAFFRFAPLDRLGAL